MEDGGLLAVAIGDRLERGLESLKDIQWEIRENEPA